MNKNDARVLMAVSEIERLNQMHDKFMEFVQTLSTINSHAGTIGVNNNNLQASCLGVLLTVKRNTVAKDGLPVLVEYSFTIPDKESDLVVFNLYLGLEGVLYAGTEEDSHICDYNNTYLANNLLNAIAIDLLGSEAFAPSKKG